MITLYHSSPEMLNKINDSGVFWGIFGAKNKSVAESHHSNLHLVKLEESEILTNYALNYELDYETVKKSLLLVVNAESLERMWEIAIEEEQLSDDDFSLFNADNFADASWEAQRIRGQVAKNLGYKAVEMDDEHGTTYLINSLAKVEAI